MKTSYHLYFVSLESTVNSTIIYFKSEMFSYFVDKICEKKGSVYLLLTCI